MQIVADRHGGAVAIPTGLRWTRTRFIISTTAGVL